jgi:sporulation protein YlmC with PRC-barrel domain
MKLSLKEILGYSIESSAQVTGEIRDFLFDDEYWVIRYVDADLGIDMPERRVLVPQTFFKETDWVTQNFKVTLSRAGLATCPALDKFQPISRLYEEELNKHYRLANYWARNYNSPDNKLDKMTHFSLPEQKFNAAPKLIREHDLDTNLRSFKEILGYNILTSDGQLGCVDDLLIDSDDWGIISIIVDASKNNSEGKKVIVASMWIEKVSYLAREIKISLAIKEVENSPEYNPLAPVNEVIEKRYYNYLGKPIT